MNESIQSQLDEQLKKKRSAKVVEASDAPLLTPDVLERDKRLKDLVEINLRDQTARVVETSNAPELTADVLAAKGKPIRTVELVFDGQVFQVGVRHGKPMHVEVAHSRVLNAFKEQMGEADELTPALLEERDTAVKRLLVSLMITDPVTTHPMFSYENVGVGHPIEDCSQILLNALWEAYTAIQFPREDDIYQVQVLRGTPLDIALLLGETFEAYPVENLGKKFIDMSDRELEAVEKRSLAQRRVLVALMLPDVPLSLNGQERSEKSASAFESKAEGNDLAAESLPNPDFSAEGATPVEDLSEAMLATLFEAYRVANIPAAGLDPWNDFAQWSKTETGRIRIANLWITSTEAGKLPSERICPDADINFRFGLDEICAEIGLKEIADAQKRKNK